MRPLVILFSFLLPVTGVCAPAATPTPAQTTAQTSPHGNVYMAGGNLTIAQPIATDLIAAGGRVSVERDVGADGAIAGGTVDIRAAIAEDLRVAGGTVNIQSNVGADLVAAGGSLSVTEAARIAGPAWLAGGNVNMAGRVANGARIYANKITLSGRIVGDTRLVGQEIVLTPNARIEGNLTYASPTALPENQRAQISGTVTRLETPEEWRRAHAEGTARALFRPLFFLSMLFCGTLLYVLFPNAVLSAERAIGQYPVRSLLIGLALLFTIPPVAVLFMITVIGLPVGFALLLLYPLALLLGYLASAFFLGRTIAIALKKYVEPPSWKRQVLFLALALLVLSLAVALPFIGFLVLVLAVVFGLGGWATSAHLQYSARR